MSQGQYTYNYAGIYLHSVGAGAMPVKYFGEKLPL